MQNLSVDVTGHDRGSARRNNPDPTPGSDNERDPQWHLSLGQRAQDRVRRAKTKVRAIKHRLLDDNDQIESDQVDLHTDPAFDPSDVAGCEQTESSHGLFDKLAHAVKDPTSAIKRKTAEKVAIHDRPHLHAEDDHEFLAAHDDLYDLHEQSTTTSDDGYLFAMQCDKQRRIDELHDIRNGRQAAWTSSRYINRVVVDRRQIISKPRPADFWNTDEATGSQTFAKTAFLWARIRYLAKDFAANDFGNIDYDTHDSFDRDLCLQYVERMIKASSPWQSCFLSMRSLYRWEDPAKTGRWAAIWFCIWYCDYPMTFLLSWVAYTVVVSGRHSSVKAIRSARDRSFRPANGESQPLKLDELIQLHGSQHWIDPLLDSIGPTVQLQLSDTADFLEILQNFHDWRNPTATRNTLFWIICAIAVALFASRDMSVKLVWLYILLSFFFGMPIASKHLQYRHAVNGLKWVFWDIPTNADMAIAHLRAKAQKMLADMADVESRQESGPESSARIDGTSDDPDDAHADLAVSAATAAAATTTTFHDDAVSWRTATSLPKQHETVISSFRCRVNNHAGRLTVSSGSISFMRSGHLPMSDAGSDTSAGSNDARQWSYDWPSLLEMSKTDSEKVSGLHVQDGKLTTKREGITFLFDVDAHHVDHRSARSASEPEESIVADVADDGDRHEAAGTKHKAKTQFAAAKRRIKGLASGARDNEPQVSLDRPGTRRQSRVQHGASRLDNGPGGGGGGGAGSDSTTTPDRDLLLRGDTHQTKTVVLLRVTQVEKRDKAFNCILGFSGLAFHVVEPFPRDKIGEPHRGGRACTGDGDGSIAGNEDDDDGGQSGNGMSQPERESKNESREGEWFV